MKRRFIVKEVKACFSCNFMQGIFTKTSKCGFPGMGMEIDRNANEVHEHCPLQTKEELIDYLKTFEDQS